MTPRNKNTARPEDRRTTALDTIESITSLPLTLALVIPALVFCVCAIFVVPRIEQVLKDFKTELPRITQISLGVARWAAGGGWSVIILVPLLVPIVLTQLSQARHAHIRSVGRLLWSLNLGLLLSLLVVGWFAAAMLLPMVSLIQTVSSPAK